MSYLKTIRARRFQRGNRTPSPARRPPVARPSPARRPAGRAVALGRLSCFSPRKPSPAPSLGLFLAGALRPPRPHPGRPPRPQRRRWPRRRALSPRPLRRAVNPSLTGDFSSPEFSFLCPQPNNSFLVAGARGNQQEQNK